MKKLALLSMSLVLGQFAHAETISKGVYFTSGDWEVACDNTRTCRAAGYQSDEMTQPISVLLTRKAGAQQAVSGDIMLGSTDEDKEPTDTEVQMKINGQNYGKVSIVGEFIGHLSTAQIEGILSSVKKTAQIDFIGKQQKWRISDKGIAAALLKMDDVQGRINTTGALVKKGKLGEEHVLAALPIPTVNTVKVTSTSVKWSPAQLSQLLTGLKGTFKPDQDDCPQLTNPEGEKSVIELTRLNDQKLLASTACWSGAYNMGSGYWVINAKPPYQPVLVTSSASDYQNGQLSSAQKGRGLGDCWSSESWAWDGKQFVHTGSATTGLCKLVAAGGAWNLPTLVSNVR